MPLPNRVSALGGVQRERELPRNRRLLPERARKGSPGAAPGTVNGFFIKRWLKVRSKSDLQLSCQGKSLQPSVICRDLGDRGSEYPESSGGYYPIGIPAPKPRLRCRHPRARRPSAQLLGRSRAHRGTRPPRGALGSSDPKLVCAPGHGHGHGHGQGPRPSSAALGQRWELVQIPKSCRFLVSSRPSARSYPRVRSSPAISPGWG